MAAAELGAELKCSICLNIYTDPVTLSCGHNFCQICIQDLLRNQDHDGVYTCPECRTQFSTRPTVQRNTTLCNVVEQCHTWLRREEATGTCPLHRLLLKYYCFEDTVRICADCCASVQHRGHQTMPMNEAAEKIRQDLRNLLEQLVSGDELDGEVQSFQEHTQKVRDKSATVKESVTVLIQDIISRLLDLKKGVLAEISKQEQQALLLTSNQIQNLKVMKDDHYCKIICIEDLSNMADDLTVLRIDVPDLSCPNVEDFHSPDMDDDLISKTLNTGLVDIVTGVTRGIFVPEALNATLNAKTAGSNVDISADLKTASWSPNNRGRPQNGERFEYNQVLSSESYFSGRQYFEIETSETGNWMIGMAYSSIDRRGHQSLLGDNDRSWCLRRHDDEYSVTHQKEVLQLTFQPSLNRFRILLDYEAGQLSIYELSDQTRHLHTFTATFTEPLHVALWVWSAWVRIRS
ncbi:PREDICTED: E3 ubiquitin-protein ligase TRIM39-like [Nanorana parkeri]|uniref:E3 ubiquitin-protein ligase TRIM39-like n=1 Tax=Nanorana parkeri TaxID=125878 RepID=UPI0008544C4A|nr:PREDICTED: E3 ubiquitin-protein ligase TRIM39-like [Nanorana parkeri]